LSTIQVTRLSNEVTSIPVLVHVNGCVCRDCAVAARKLNVLSNAKKRPAKALKKRHLFFRALTVEELHNSSQSATETSPEPPFNSEESIERQELRQRLKVAQVLARRNLHAPRATPQSEDSGYSGSSDDEDAQASDMEPPEIVVPLVTSSRSGFPSSRPEWRRKLRAEAKKIPDVELSEADTDTATNGFLRDSTYQLTASNLQASSLQDIERPRRCPRVHGYLCNGEQQIRSRILLDTGASHNFISSDVAAALNLLPDQRLGPPALSGAHPDHPVLCSGMLRNVSLKLPVTEQQVHRMSVNFVVSEISHADIILGMPWWEATCAALQYETSEDNGVTRATAIKIMTDKSNSLCLSIPLLNAKSEASLLLLAAPKLVKSKKQIQKLLGHGEFFRVTVHDILSDSLDASRDAEAIDPSLATVEAINSPTPSPIPLSPSIIAKAMEDVAADPDAYPGAANLTKELIEEFSDVFAPPYKMPPPRAYDHVIDLEGRAPPRTRRVPRFSLAELEVIRVWLKEMIDKGWMVPSRSPYGAPLIIVRKPGGGHRVVQDMRALNSVTKKAATPLPIFENLIVSFSGAKYFSTMDMASFFFQIRLREEDRELTAVSTPYGLYEFRVAAMGLVNSPSTALLVMQDILRDYIGKDVGVFVDDVIVHSVEEVHHCKILRELLTIFRKEELHVSLGKCHFLRTKVAFLGHIVGKDGLQANPERCAAIASWPRPVTLTQLRSFLGLTSFYRRFIEGFAKIAAPLTSLLAIDAGFHKSTDAWGPIQEAAFVELRKRLSSPPILRLYDPSLPFVLRTDASDYAMGCALYQRYPNGLLYPIEYRSRKFTPVQSRYSAHEREFLAVLMALRELRCYLRGVPFTLQTDNSALAQIKSSRELSSKYQRWFDEFEEYPCDIEHRPGRSMGDCDALSRRETEDGDLDPAGPPVRVFDPDDRSSSFFNSEGILNDKNINECLSCLEYVKLKKSSIESNQQDRWQVRDFWSQDTNLPFAPVERNTREHFEDRDAQLFVVKGKGRKKDTAAKSVATWYHPTVSQWSKAYASDPDFTWLWNNGKGRPDSQFKIVNKLMYRVDDRPGRVRKAWETPAQEWWRLCVPDVGTAQNDYLSELHSAPLAGHRGRNATIDRARCNLYWPGMTADVRAFVQSCSCQFHKYVRTKPGGMAKPLPVPDRPWSIISADWVGPLAPDTTGHDTILVIVCHLSGQIHLVPCRSTDDAVDTADAFLQNVIRLHGLPQAIVSDRDPKFTSIFWRSLCERLGTKLRLSTAFYPQSDGKTERFNAVIEEVLRCYVNARQDDWIDWLPHAEFAINSATSQSTGLSPFFVNYGFEPTAPWVTVKPSFGNDDPASSTYATNLQSIHEFCRDALQRAKDRQAIALNKRRNVNMKPFAVGDQVLLSTKNLNLRTASYKLTARYLGPFKVLAATSNTVTLDTPDYALTARNHNVFNNSYIRRYYSRPTRLFSGSDVPPKSFLVDGVPHYEIDGIIAKRMRGKNLEYLVVWKGLPLASSTWQPPCDIPTWYCALFDNRHPSEGDGLDDLLDDSKSIKRKVSSVQVPLPLAPLQSSTVRTSRTSNR
jgi:hypothetical protein